ncbi:DUF367 family protein [Sulfolobus tengchongensis]|uniref:16S rRNA aminocarboxypropyltransferase n=1 Tax=Sulfolobus tengchongensis TaxID=207809 RepID=A0AAX4KYK8_9CREN
MQIFVIEFEQDDPKKCTAKRMIRKGFAIRVRTPKGILLNPISNKTLSYEDREIIQKRGLTVLDSSWNKSDEKFFKKYENSLSRRLPFLLAGNPINYAKPFKLSSLEAVAASLIIIGEKELGLKLLSLVKWGPTFYKLNENLLEAYYKKSEREILEVEEEFLAGYLGGP